jgi:hypothetical protein
MRIEGLRVEWKEQVIHNMLNRHISSGTHRRERERERRKRKIRYRSEDVLAVSVYEDMEIEQAARHAGVDTDEIRSPPGSHGES